MSRSGHIVDGTWMAWENSSAAAIVAVASWGEEEREKKEGERKLHNFGKITPDIEEK